MTPKYLLKYLFATILFLMFIGTGHALVPVTYDDASIDSLLIPYKTILALTTDSSYNAQFKSMNSGWLRFTDHHEGPWTINVDKRTGRPSLMWGKGVPWIPGRGNSLTLKETFPSKTGNFRISIQDLELLARDFIDEYPELFGVSSENLVINSERSMPVLNNTVWFVDFDYYLHNIRVLDARIFFRVNNGNLIQFGSKNILVTDSLEKEPRIDSFEALFTTFDYLGLKETGREEIRDYGTLYYLPVADNPFLDAQGTGDLSYRLVYRVSFRRPGKIPTWVSYIDAVTGEIVAVYDNNKYGCYDTLYQGLSSGGVFGQLDDPGSAPEKVKPLPYTRIIDDYSAVATDFNGLYPYSGNFAWSGLNGEYFDLDCVGCTNPPQAYYESSGNGNMEFGTGGNNTVGNGYSTKAERNTFYHLNIARALGAKWLTGLPWFDSIVPATVNIASTCNAFWDGTSVNFYRGGGGCNNMGEVAGVVQHEWGHGLDQNTTGGPVGDGARGEGIGDHLAFMSSHDPRVGPYFFTDGTPVRNVDSAVSGLRTISNLGTYCGPGFGPMGYEVHCEGEIYGQAGWDLSGNLVTTHGVIGGWYVSERLFFSSLPTSDTYVPDQPGSSYAAYMAVDDDNGDLSDGTPNADDINTAFQLHEIANSTLVTGSTPCTPPVGPLTTATPFIDPLTGIYQVRLTWADVPGAAFYNILRNDIGPGDIYVPIALNILPPTVSFLDMGVSNGQTYNYIVQVVDGAACVSTNDNHVAATLALPENMVETYIVDDSTGNGNGYVDPGESITLELTALNRGIVTSHNTIATMEVTHPDVVLIDSTYDFANIDPGVSKSTTAPHFSFSIANKPELCGQSVSLTIFFESDEGCWGDRITFILGGGVVTSILFDDFETDRGWTVGDPTDTATTGIWERTDPDETGFRGFIYQPEDDHTPDPGVICWVTGNGPGGGGADDVDDGCTTLYSPVYDMSGYPVVYLSYWRWYTITTSMDDELLVEISNNGGSSWQTLETVNSTTQPWTFASFNLKDIFDPMPVNQVQVRFIACDTGDGSLIEALIDDFALSAPYCDDGTPHPKLEYVSHGINDGITLGVGNANGKIQPGETVHISVDVENIQNMTATSVTGVLTIDPPIAGITVLDGNADFPDVDPSDTETSVEPHFAIDVAEDPSLCGTEIEFKLTMHYTGGTTAYDREFQFTDTVSNEDYVIYFDNFDGPDDNGWKHGMVKTQDDWQRGDPAGRSDDPDDAYSSPNVWGNDIGVGAWNGEYQPNVRNHLHSPSIDCSSATEVRMSFWRWLNVEDGDYDQARIFVNANLIWENPSGYHTEDDAWVYQEFDITSSAAGEYSVVVAFELESDGGLEMGGWNIDDFTLFSQGCEVYYRYGTPTPTPVTSGSPVPSATPTYSGIPVPVTSHAGIVLVFLGFIALIGIRLYQRL